MKIGWLKPIEFTNYKNFINKLNNLNRNISQLYVSLILECNYIKYFFYIKLRLKATGQISNIKLVAGCSFSYNVIFFLISHQLYLWTFFALYFKTKKIWCKVLTFRELHLIIKAFSQVAVCRSLQLYYVLNVFYFILWQLRYYVLVVFFIL